jgi:hypothetical protein
LFAARKSHYLSLTQEEQAQQYLPYSGSFQHPRVVPAYCSDVSVVLPYSCLHGALLEEDKVVLLHPVATAEIAGPPAVLAEILQLVSQQRLAVVRQGIDSLTITVSITNDDAAKGRASEFIKSGQDDLNSV